MIAWRSEWNRAPRPRRASSTSRPEPAVGSAGTRATAVRLEEPGQILPQHEGDGRPAGRRLARAARLTGRGIVIRRRRARRLTAGPTRTSPDRHRSSSHSGRYDSTRSAKIRSHSPAGNSKPWSCSITSATPGPALAPRPGSGVPPGLEEVLPLLLADGTHLGPPPLAGVAVDAGQQPAGAPLLAPLGLEPPAHREAACPQGLEGDGHRGRRRPVAAASSSTVTGPETSRWPRTRVTAASSAASASSTGARPGGSG